jgi:glycosyltransferase involved in cell wall biosynthesis
MDQTYDNFEVLIIFKPSGDSTEVAAKKHAGSLKIKLIRQTKGYLVDALNLGLKNATGDIIAFLDDDAIPASDWIQQHVETYNQPNVGGVAGDVIPSSINGEKLAIYSKSSEIIPESRPFMVTLASKLWSCPLVGQEDYFLYISKAGTMDYNFNIALQAKHQVTKSVLGMGANMSVLAKAVKDFQFPNSWVLGLGNEQFLGWHIWRKGYNLIFNPKAEVYHLEHGQTLSRNIRDSKREHLRWIERDLLFYRLYGIEKNLSSMHRISWLIFSTADNIKKICRNRETDRIVRMKASFNSALIGLKWLLSRKLRGYYSPLIDMRKYIK